MKVGNNTDYILNDREIKICYSNIKDNNIFLKIKGKQNYKEFYTENDDEGYSFNFILKIAIDLIETPKNGLLNSTVNQHSFDIKENYLQEFV